MRAGPAPSVPRATYRVQLHREFTFRDACAIVPYLAALGISHLYASPFLKARAGSVHGYDIVDHASLNPEIGTPDDLDALVAALRAHGMGLMLDLVPNHMGVLRADNGWWVDVLEHGQASRHADFFDIDWTPESEELRGKVLIPILGDHYGSVLERGELALRFDAAAGALSLWYFEHRLPVRPATYPRVLLGGIERLAGAADAQAALRDAADQFAAITDDPAIDSATATARAKAALATACARDPAVARAIDDSVAAYNGVAGEPASFDALHALVGGQHYRLAFWRVAADDINYRRFFDINDLAALRAERDDVFAATHRIALDLVRARKADALRVDHPDGLLDPGGYFTRLQAAVAALTGDAGAGDAQGRAIYLVIEKILASHERLPKAWPVHGTTGYRFMNVVNRLFVDPTARRAFDNLYASFTGEHDGFDETVRRAKALIITHAMRSELARLANALTRIAKADRHTCDFTRDSIQRALVAIVACFPVYRTYATSAGLSADDAKHIEWAVAIARHRSAAADTSVFEFVSATLRGDRPHADPAVAAARREFVGRFQQFTSPVMAKGMEDTAFYIYNRLVSLNEVGGDPRLFGSSVRAFHGASIVRARKWPNTMLATSTHDSKRGEDVRTRIDALSEMPAAWRAALRRWGQVNRRHRVELGGQQAPSRNDEYLLYQTLLGAWPATPLTAQSLAEFRERIQAYMRKAVREAKVHTSWLNPDADYESALASFIDRLLEAPDNNRFIDAFLPLQQRLARIGCVNSLAQTLVKLTSPGVPDTYQGTEMWDFDLVDPDNRRPVDYAARAATLHEFAGCDAAGDPTEALLSSWPDGRVKLWLTWRLLELRRRRGAWFAHAGYMPVAALGRHAHRVCAYARRRDDELLLCIVPRMWSGLAGEGAMWPIGAPWADTALMLPRGARRWRNVLTATTTDTEQSASGSRLAVAAALATFPVGVFELE